MHKDIRKLVKELQREGVIVAIEPGAKHWRVTLRNGTIYTLCGNGGDHRLLRNTVAQIQRLLRLTPP